MQSESAPREACHFHVFERLAPAAGFEQNDIEAADSEDLEEMPFAIGPELSAALSAVRLERARAWLRALDRKETLRSDHELAHILDAARQAPASSEVEERVWTLCEAIESGDPVHLVSGVAQALAGTTLAECLHGVTVTGDTWDCLEAIHDRLSETEPASLATVHALAGWLHSRCERPMPGLPSWMARLYASFDESREACRLLAWSIVAQLEGDRDHVGDGDEVAQPEGRVELQSLTRGDASRVDVTLLRASDLLRLERPVVLQECVRGSQRAIPAAGTVQVFVSHAWRERTHPDPDGEDWRSLRDYVRSAIATSVELHRTLSSLGFDAEMIATGAFDYVIAGGSHVRAIGYELADGGFVSGVLARDLLALSGENARARAVETHRAVSEQVLLWLDYVSLPQSIRGFEYAPGMAEERQVMATLRELGALQREMHTLVVNTASDYRQRAWCVAELLNVELLSFVDSVANDPRRAFGARDPLVDALRQMVGTESRTSEQVLHGLGLKFSDTRDADRICRILWLRVVEFLREDHAWWDQMGSLEEGQPWVVASGRAESVLEYLRELNQLGPRLELFDEGWLRWRRRWSDEPQPPEGAAARRVSILAPATAISTCERHSLLDHFGAAARALEQWLRSEGKEAMWVELRFVDEFNEADGNPGLRVALPSGGSHGRFADWVVRC